MKRPLDRFILDFCRQCDTRENKNAILFDAKNILITLVKRTNTVFVSFYPDLIFDATIAIKDPPTALKLKEVYRQRLIKKYRRKFLLKWN